MADREVWLETNGLRFRAIRSAGQEAGATALFLHATSFCADTWQPVWRAARATGWKGAATAVDQRGHGRSEAPTTASDYRWTGFAEDAAAILESMRDGGSTRALVAVGHSSGATAALSAAGMRPAHVQGLVLVEPVLFDRPSDASGDSFAGSGALAAAARRRRARFASRTEAAQRLRTRFPYSGFDAGSLDAYLQGALRAGAEGGLELCCTPQREAWIYEGAAELDLWPFARRVKAPALLVLGEHSAVPPALRDRLLEILPSARVERVPGATHFAALEQPQQVGAIIGGFIEELSH